MLLSQRFSKLVAIATVCFTFASGFPAQANSGTASGAVNSKQNSASSISTESNDHPTLIASAGCSACGANLEAISLMATEPKKKSESLLTDSLWGNLILEMAYQRDKELHKIAKRMNLVSFGTLAAIGAISAGTLAQGIDALIVLNPHDGHQDSYSPGIVGVAMSSVTVLTFLSRFYFNHRFQKQVKERQLAIKTQVESVLNHMEQCDAKCGDAQKQLTELIGPRACREWVQLYQSSHKLAMSTPREVSFMLTTGQVK